MARLRPQTKSTWSLEYLVMEPDHLRRSYPIAQMIKISKMSLSYWVLASTSMSRLVKDFTRDMLLNTSCSQITTIAQRYIFRLLTRLEHKIVLMVRWPVSTPRIQKNTTAGYQQARMPLAIRWPGSTPKIILLTAFRRPVAHYSTKSTNLSRLANHGRMHANTIMIATDSSWKRRQMTKIWITSHVLMMHANTSSSKITILAFSLSSHFLISIMPTAMPGWMDGSTRCVLP